MVYRAAAFGVSEVVYGKRGTGQRNCDNDLPSRIEHAIRLMPNIDQLTLDVRGLAPQGFIGLLEALALRPNLQIRSVAIFDYHKTSTDIVEHFDNLDSLHVYGHCGVFSRRLWRLLAPAATHHPQLRKLCFTVREHHFHSCSAALLDFITDAFPNLEQLALSSNHEKFEWRENSGRDQYPALVSASIFLWIFEPSRSCSFNGM